MFCGFCGKTIRDDAAFCPFCGKSLKVKAAGEEATAPIQDAKDDLIERFTATLPYTPDDVMTEKAQLLKDENRQLDELKQKPCEPPVIPRSAPEPSEINQADRHPIPAEDTGTKPATAHQKPAPAPAAPKKPNPAPATPKKPAPVPAAPKKPASAPAAPKKRKAVRSDSKPRPTRQMRNNRTYFVLSLVSKLLLLLIPLAAYLPYCRIAYSADRSANMPLWKLILGGTYTMGRANPLEFSLISHHTLAVLLLIPLLVVLIAFFRRSKAKLPIASLMLQADGAAVLFLNIKLLRTIQDIVSGLSVETFAQQVTSMNNVVIKWVQNAIAGKLSMEDTFYVTWQLGWGLMILFGGIMVLLGLMGMILWIVHLFQKADDTPEDQAANRDEDEVPELTEDML